MKLEQIQDMITSKDTIEKKRHNFNSTSDIVNYFGHDNPNLGLINSIRYRIEEEKRKFDAWNRISEKKYNLIVDLADDGLEAHASLIKARLGEWYARELASIAKMSFISRDEAKRQLEDILFHSRQLIYNDRYNRLAKLTRMKESGQLTERDLLKEAQFVHDRTELALEESTSLIDYYKALINNLYSGNR